jgi:alanine racemase
MSRPTVAYINLTHLRHNYRVLAERAGTASTMAVVKADAYGHGLHLIAPALLDAGCRCFSVTDAVEGMLLRRIVGGQADIVLLSGIFDAADAELCCDHTLIPALTELTQVSLLAAASFRGKAWLKVDTGMRRLGTTDAPALHAACVDRDIEIAGLMSHLACADEPGHALNAQQAACFGEIADTLPAATPKSLLNSAGIVSMPQYAFDVVRPGIALYGAEPVANRPLGLKPVMRLCARVLQVRDVRRGESVSYGASFTAKQDMRIATVAMGYADGLPRALSNRGHAYGATAILPIVGRVCMDYCLLDVSQGEIVAGSEVEFWGDALPAVRVAQDAGTIAYELFTGVGNRVIRKAVA